MLNHRVNKRELIHVIASGPLRPIFFRPPCANLFDNKHSL